MHPLNDRPLRAAFVLWSGDIGGAENFTAELANAMKGQHTETAIVFVHEAATLGDRLDELGIHHTALGLRRGRDVLRAHRRFARTVSESSPDVAILVSSGYLAAALRAGGYGGPIIAIEHGSLLQQHQLHPIRRAIRKADRLSGLKACSAIVAVSEYMRVRVPAGGRPRIVCIPNGVDLERFLPPTNGATPADGINELVVGCASRLVDGKGVEDVIHALSHPSLAAVHLRIAGDGPRRGALEALARSLEVDERAEFLGPVLDMPRFWRSTDVAVVPSNGAVESFGMAAVEAMACAKPVVTSDSGALPEVVVNGETGRVVPAGDVATLVAAIGEYAGDPDLRARHGANGRRRCEQHFGIDLTAARYLELCAELLRKARPGKRDEAVRSL